MADQTEQTQVDPGLVNQAYLATKPSATNTEEPIPVDDAQRAQFDPQQYLTQKRIDQYNALQSQYGSTGQQALAGLEAFGRGASLGTSGLLETKLGLTTPEAMAGRAEANPYTSGLGNIAGGAALIGVTGGLSAPVEAGLVGAGAKGILPRVIGHAAEGATFGAGNVVSDYSMGDPNLNGQKILADIGFGAALGGGLGALSKGIEALPAMLRKAPAEIAPTGAVSAEQALNEAGLGAPDVPLTAAEEMTQAGDPNAPKFRDSVPLESLDEADRAPIVDGLNNLKPEAPLISDSAKTLGTIAPEGSLIADEPTQKMIHALNQSPSPTGIASNRLYNAAWEKGSQTMAETLGEGSDLSLAQAGDQAKELLSNAVSERYQPVKDLYDKIETVYPQIPVANKAGAQNAILDLIDEHGLVKGTPEYDTVEKFGNRLNDIDRLQQLQNFRTALNRNTGPENSFIAEQIRDRIDDLEHSSIKSFASSLEDPEAQKGMLGLSDQLDQARGMYSDFRGTIGKIGKVLWGNKKIYGAQDFLNKIADETPEKVANRLFSKNNARALEYMHENFPEVTQTLSAYEKAKLRAASLTDGKFSAKKFNNQYAGISPEMKNVIFTPEEQKVFDAGKVYFDHFLKNFNPSGTAGTQAYIEYMKHPVASAANWGKDILLSQYIKHKVNLSPEQFEQAQFQANQASKLKAINGILNRTTDRIKDGVAAIFSPTSKNTVRGAFLSGTTQMSDKDYDKNTAIINQYASNPQKMMDDISENTNSLHNAAPNITRGYQTSYLKGVQYLQSKIPKPVSTYPLSAKWEPTQAQKNQFIQSFNTVNDPIHSLQQIKNGSLSNETMEALNAVHPDLLQSMRQQIVESMDTEQAKKLPYGQKVALSKFMGQPMDGSLTPQAIMSNQTALNSNLSQQSLPKQGRKSTQAGLAKLNLSNRTQTLSEQLRQGDEENS